MGKYKQKWAEGDFADKTDLEEESVAFEQEGLTDAQVHDHYFKWLCTPLLEKNKHDYWSLLKQMDVTTFRWSVANDDNRGADGIKLRDQFIEDQDLGIYEWSILLQRPCSVLEMIIGVAVRMEDVMYCGDFTRWFWEIIDNLGMSEFTDVAYYTNSASVWIKFALDNLLSRNYQRNGQGGLFPMKGEKIDQRKVEIWYQMQAYLQERHADEI
jgi:hypothetical protein